MDDYQLSNAAQAWQQCLDRDERIGPYRANCVLDIQRFVSENAARYVVERLRGVTVTRSLTDVERFAVARYTAMYGILRDEFVAVA